ncbi:LOW QUALITY PROTEIN: hypothetical protein Cgig2_014349 [Carnegiea gigantea]|uniref:Uncharacterized protein n=1 Tax=Carnegiea gigantea TaxID=171969 RepID=A0A9Q1Q602_9CARY|nr:LOW QUALITY PROTEIN: hypothetical protein Cgig2_014349 [Carnegiea gigantea]
MINRLKKALTNDKKLLRTVFAYFVGILLSVTAVKTTLSSSTTALIDLADNLDDPYDMDFNNLLDLETTLHCHHMLICSKYSPKYYFLHDVLHLRNMLLMHFISSDLKCLLPQLRVNKLVNQLGNKDEDRLGSKTKLKIVSSRKPLEPCVLSAEHDSSHVKISRIDVVIPSTPIYAIPIQNKIVGCIHSRANAPPQVPYNQFDRLPSLKGDFDSLYAIILQRGVDVTSLESKIEGLIKQAYDLKDL